MQITHALISKFFDDACTPEEAERVSQYLAEHPAELRNHLLGDWEKADNETDLALDQTNEMLTYISHRLPDYHRSRGIARRYVMGWSAAAGIVLTASLVWLFNGIRKDKASAPVYVSGVVAAALKDPAWKDLVNERASVEKVTLSDGTIVSLYSHGHLRYREPLAADKRELFLEGQATFEVKPVVAVSGRIPFTVRAGNVTTTVLGTVFNVQENASGVAVKLYKGKVSVRASERDIILLPGEQMRYEAGSGRSQVSLFHDEAPGPAGARPVARPFDTRRELIFDNTPIPVVIDQLFHRYHVPIIYDEKGIEAMHFTGNVSSSDSLLTILYVIADMNGLTVTPGGGGYRLAVK